MRIARLRCGFAAVLFVALATPAVADPVKVLTGASAFGDWQEDAPGVRRKITPAALPTPLATEPVANSSHAARRPQGASPKVPAGFAVDLLASGLDRPRVLRTAPNGDVFVAESGAGRIRVLRGADGPAGQAT